MGLRDFFEDRVGENTLVFLGHAKGEIGVCSEGREGGDRDVLFLTETEEVFLAKVGVINAEEYAALQNSETPVVIDFHATWCGPCKVLSPILEELEEEVENVQFVKLDVDQFPEIAGANQVMGVPTVVILKGGEVKERFVGVQPKETIKEKITALS